MRIYVASSWRNGHQQGVVSHLRDAGHDVYDFKNPAPGDNGFHWQEVDRDWEEWTAERFRTSLDHPVARAGFKADMDALQGCDACVLVLPCGRSAHLELGWATGAGKRTAVLLCPEQSTTSDDPPVEKVVPELMYLMLGKICVSLDEVTAWLATAPNEEPK